LEENHHIILFSALDWGLGHTTRSIPILTHFNKKGCQLFIAVQPGSASEKILQRHFPDAIYQPLQGYGITYARKKRFFALKILLQVPKILQAIQREHRFVKKTASAYPIQLIISDNRYGFYHRSVPSIFITHQLRIAAPLKILENWIQHINYRYIRRFSQVWIPDFKGKPNLAGLLSHPRKMPLPVAHYIGPLSRLTEPAFDKAEPAQCQSHQAVSSCKYLFLLSGPEPQRSILEKRLLETAHRLPGKSVLVRGLPAEVNAAHGSPDTEHQPETLSVIGYANPTFLLHLIQSADFIVCRSGYSTVMDLILLGKKGIYIPTPGQTEQEYLAKHLMHQHWGFSFSQDEVDYTSLLAQAGQFNYQLPVVEKGNLEQIIHQIGPLTESGDF